LLACSEFGHFRKISEAHGVGSLGNSKRRKNRSKLF
jgi:hypothetical protein